MQDYMTRDAASSTSVKWKSTLCSNCLLFTYILVGHLIPNVKTIIPVHGVNMDNSISTPTYYPNSIEFSVPVASGGLLIADNHTATNTKLMHYNDANFKIVENLIQMAFRKNILKGDSTGDGSENSNGGQFNTLPTDALDGIYSQCLLTLSFPCLQKKLIIFLRKLDKMNQINLLGKSVSLVRRTNRLKNTQQQQKPQEKEPILDEPKTAGPQSKSNIPDDELTSSSTSSDLKDIIDNQIDEFFNTRSLRLRLPKYLEDGSGAGSATSSTSANGNDDADATYFDIDFHTEATSRNGRKKKLGKLKGMKKLLMIIGLLTCVKLTLMAPLMLAMLGLKALKAMILSVIALTISKMTMMGGKFDMHSLMKSSHDLTSGMASYSSGAMAAAGWDRNLQNIQEITVTPSTLPSLTYDMEPPTSYSTYRIRKIVPTDLEADF